MLAKGKMFMALAGSPSEKPIAVIYGASDGCEPAPLPLTSPSENICQMSKAEGCACPREGRYLGRRVPAWLLELPGAFLLGGAEVKGQRWDPCPRGASCWVWGWWC